MCNRKLIHESVRDCNCGVEHNSELDSQTAYYLTFKKININSKPNNFNLTYEINLHPRYNLYGVSFIFFYS